MDRDDSLDPSLDPDAPASAEEIAEAETLRRALAGEPAESAGADFARAVSLAHSPRPISAEEHRAIVARGVAEGAARRARSRRRRSGALVTVASALALAAALALFVRADREGASQRGAAASIEPLVPVRSTQPLFREPFARTGGESARIDRITASRSADLRDNRFAAWGVR